jgi:hypothetical protein
VDLFEVTFTSAHLAKHDAVLASGRRPLCVICAGLLDTYQIVRLGHLARGLTCDLIICVGAAGQRAMPSHELHRY